MVNSTYSTYLWPEKRTLPSDRNSLCSAISCQELPSRNLCILLHLSVHRNQSHANVSKQKMQMSMYKTNWLLQKLVHLSLPSYSLQSALCQRIPSRKWTLPELPVVPLYSVYQMQHHPNHRHECWFFKKFKIHEIQQMQCKKRILPGKRCIGVTDSKY